MAAIERENIPPATLPVDPNGIPDELKTGRQFVGWSWEYRKTKWTKPPLRADGSGYAKSDDPSTWASFDVVFAAYQRGAFDGIGRPLKAGGDIFFIDLDHCRDPETGEISPWARPILRLFRHTYQEISPTGTGIKIIGYGRIPGSRHVKPMVGRPGAQVELYDSGKYTTLTGHRRDEAASCLADCQAALDTIYPEFFPPQGNEPPPAFTRSAGDDDDDRRLDRARAAKNGAQFVALFDHGDTGAYGGNHSSADQGLCNDLAFWFGPDPARIDRMFRLSALMRPKWDEKHYGDGRTYGEGTIDTALAGRTEFYQPRQARLRVVVGGQDHHGGNGQNTSDGATGDDGASRPRLTEAGNAEDFARRYGAQVRFDHRRGRWLLRTADQHRWVVDPDEQVRRLALDATRARFHEAAEIEDLKERTEVASWAIKSESRSRLSATLDIAQSLHPIADAGQQWDTDPWLLGCPNGVVNLRTGALRPGTPDDRITMTTGIPYDPAAPANRWLQFLVEVFGDPDMIDYVQRVVGYCLSGDMRAQQWWLLYGRGGNGKSVFLRAIANILGDYFADVPFATFARGAGERDTYALALMENRRLVIASESGDTARLNTERIKAITGGDPQTARRPYEDYVTFSPMCKLMLTANHRPVVTDGTFAFWRRVRLIAFERTFEGECADDHLDDVLAGEAPGILAWAVQGCLAWQARGLTAPDVVLAATKDYQVESDPLAGWIAERCTPDPDARHWGSELYQDYIAWCEEQHIRERERLTNTAFGRKLGERFKKSMTKGRATWWGLRLNGVEGVEGFTPNSTTSKVPPARSEVVKNDPKPSTPSTPGRVCVHCGDSLPDEMTGLYCAQHSSYTSASEGYGSSSPLWGDLPPTDDDPEDDPWTR
ncbi:MAG: phage/plasmid primase, P4 family [Chloroflexota bacterium]|nr:phage/plasmid primase, P4 family [Chloroflexota bacterium]